jgi:hypothetical protein
VKTAIGERRVVGFLTVSWILLIGAIAIGIAVSRLDLRQVGTAPGAAAASAGAASPVSTSSGSSEPIALGPGCDKAPIVAVSDDYVSYGSMRSHLRPEPVVPAGVRPIDGPESVTLEGMATLWPVAPVGSRLILAYEDDTPEMVVVLYGTVEPDEGKSWQSFLADGGLIVRQRPPAGQDAPAAVSEAEEAATLNGRTTAGRVSIHPVGDNDAALIIGDETIGPGHRAVGLHWTDGQADWHIQAVLDRIENPAVLVDMARSIYCR